MRQQRQHLRPALVILTTALMLWSCSSSTESQLSLVRLLLVDTTTGHTEVDTVAWRQHLEHYAAKGLDSRDVPVITRLVEAEEIGDEAIEVILETYDSSIPVIAEIANEERSQAVAMNIIIDVLGIDDPHPEVGRGAYLDQDVSALWNTYIADGTHSTDIDALVAVTKVFEFQLRRAIDARPQVHSSAAKFAASLVFGMNANHFRSMCRHLRDAGIPYSPTFLTQEEFDSETSERNYLQFTDGLGAEYP